jgi:uncharacterized protein YggE
VFENTIQNPFGITVFGSARLKVSPDFAMVMASVTRVDQKPSVAFSQAQQGAREVIEFLRKSHVEEFGTSRISLVREIRVGASDQQLRYKAGVGFNIRISKLDLLENLLIGIVEAGANEITSVQFQTSQLKELRAKARILAVKSARDKALTYAKAAEVTPGPIIHIQDLNPDQFQQAWRSQFHARGSEQSQSEAPEVEGEMQTLDPAAIEVAAGVLVAFRLG